MDDSEFIAVYLLSILVSLVYTGLIVLSKYFFYSWLMAAFGTTWGNVVYLFLILTFVLGSFPFVMAYIGSKV